MDPDAYQAATAETEIYTSACIYFINPILDPDDDKYPTRADAIQASMQMLSLMYCAGKLNGEAGEVAEIVFKAFRGGELTEENRQKLFKELGDVMWYVSRIAELCDYKLSSVMTGNIEKLLDRQERGVIHGYGDER